MALQAPDPRALALIRSSRARLISAHRPHAQGPLLQIAEEAGPRELGQHNLPDEIAYVLLPGPRGPFYRVIKARLNPEEDHALPAHVLFLG